MNLDCVWLTKLSMFCRYEVRCSLCKASIASKLDTIEKHEQSEKHVEMLGNQRTCIFRGDAGHRIAQAKLHAARLKHDRGTARQMALLLHLSSKGRLMLDYPAQKKLQQHLLTDILVGVPGKLEDVAKSHIRTLVDDADKSRVEGIVQEFVKNVGSAVLDSIPEMHWTGNSGWELFHGGSPWGK